GPVIFDQHVGVLDQRAQNLDPRGLFEVERDAALVAVQVLEIEAMPLAAEALVLGGLDLDDLGAPVRELTHAGRPRAHARQIDDLESGEWKFAHGSPRPPTIGRRPVRGKALARPRAAIYVIPHDGPSSASWCSARRS